MSKNMTNKNRNIREIKSVKDVRVLHMGNIANNGYMFCRELRKKGYQSDCFVPDYYHVNGCPEWEEASFNARGLDAFAPAWHKAKVKGFKRPRWFAQGPRYMVYRYLIHKNKKNHLRAILFWNLMAFFRIIISPGRINRFFIKAWHHPFARKVFAMMGLDGQIPPVPPVNFKEIQATLPSDKLRKVLRENADIWIVENNKNEYDKFGNRINKSDYDELGNLINQSTKDEEEAYIPPIQEAVGAYDGEAEILKRLFEHYDLIIGYATDGIYPLMMGKPYIAFEHGTIRRLPFKRETMGLLTKATYQAANKVFITNCDNIIAAKKLNLQNYTFCPHPITETFSPKAENQSSSLRASLEERRGTDFIIFHPARQHWDDQARDTDWDKANDRLFRGFSNFLKEINPNALLICVESGAMVKKSKQLIKGLGISSNILWIKAKPHLEFMNWILAADCVADQFDGVTFGGIPPKAMLCKKPILTYIEPKVHDWCFSEQPPIYSANSPELVFKRLKQIYEDPEKSRDMGMKGHDWYMREYSSERLVQTYDETVKEIFSL